jgi:predicted nucleotidyltransferase
METTINKMPDYVENFYRRLNNYLGTNVYFYGSVQRADYFPEDSDIDVAIFTDNMSSMLNKISNFLKKQKHDFKRFVIKPVNSNKIATGYKMMYIEPEHNFKTEFSVYDEKYKSYILDEYYIKNNLPLYSVFLLHILKIIYYKLNIISHDLFAYLKGFIINNLTGNTKGSFVILDIKNK